MARSSTAPVVREWHGDGWRELAVAAEVQPGAPVSVAVHELRAATDPLESYGSSGGRPSAPSREVISAGAALFRLADVGRPADGLRRELQVDWAGDVAQLLVDDVVVADRYWDGTPWHLDLDTIPGALGDRVTVRVLPLHRHSTVRVPAAADDRRRSEDGHLCAIDAATLESSAVWRLGYGASQLA